MAEQLVFGVFVPQGWKMELAAIVEPADKWAATVRVAQAADTLGFDSIWVYDHFHNVPVPAQEAVFECWTTLAALSQLTERVRLGQMVSCAAYRAPGLVAKITSTLDVLSAGRLDWGIGAGWYEHEFVGYGYNFDPPADRIRVLAETVDIVRSMWTQPVTDFDGRYFQLRGAHCDPKPVQRPHPPIWIGGGGEKRTLRVVAQRADWANFGGKPHEWEHKRDVLFGHCAAIGRDPDTIGLSWSPELFVRETEAELRADWRDTWKVEEWESYRAGKLVGTPEQVCERIEQYSAMGCTAFVTWPNELPDTTSIELFARSVMPEFRP